MNSSLFKGDGQSKAPHLENGGKKPLVSHFCWKEVICNHFQKNVFLISK